MINRISGLQRSMQRFTQGGQDHQTTIKPGPDRQTLRDQESRREVSHVAVLQDHIEGLRLEVATEMLLLLDLGHRDHPVPLSRDAPPHPDLAETHQEEDGLILINDLPLLKGVLRLQGNDLLCESVLPLLVAAPDHPGELLDLLLEEIDLDHRFVVQFVLLDALVQEVHEDHIGHHHTDIQVDSDLLPPPTDQGCLINGGHAARYTVVALGHHNARVEGVDLVMADDHLVVDIDPVAVHGPDNVAGAAAVDTNQRMSKLRIIAHT